MFCSTISSVVLKLVRKLHENLTFFLFLKFGRVLLAGEVLMP